MKLVKYCLYLLIPAMSMVSCKKSEFVAININPSTLTSVDPGNQFLTAAIHVSNDFEYYYDFYQDIGPWMQYWTNSAGNGPGFTNPGHFNYRYSNFYSNVGLPLSDIPHLIEKMSASDQAARVYEAAIASIYKAYYAFYVSDVDGSIPYSQAFQARYGGTLTPVYDPQQNLFDTLDTQIKAAVKTLETTQSVAQTAYNAYDPFYGTAPDGTTASAAAQVTSWIKAGNALRLKIAMRLMKREPSKLQSIATEVLADANQMASIDDSWVLIAGPSYAGATSNYNPTGLYGTQPMIDFMSTKQDPRLSIFYRKNRLGGFVGAPVSPDDVALPVNQALFKKKDTALSAIQHRLFTPAFDEGAGAGTGQGFFPVLTYAEYCFIRAELGARAITGDDAATWYNAGITASINFYSARAAAAAVDNFTAATPSAITTYLGMSGITYDPTKGVEQIACQAYLDFYRQPAEAWAWWKRTGFPNTTSVLAWSPVVSGGATLSIPRRAPLTTFSSSDANYANQKAAYDAMATDPGFGTGASDAHGRVWWDQQ